MYKDHQISASSSVFNTGWEYHRRMLSLGKVDAVDPEAGEIRATYLSNPPYPLDRVN